MEVDEESKNTDNTNAPVPDIERRISMKLGPYKGIRAHVPAVKIQEQEIQHILEQKQVEYSIVHDVTDRPAKCGDQVVLDFDGTLDGAPIPQGRSRNFFLILGSHSFIRGFEEQIVGKRVGEQFDIYVTFPRSYFMKALREKNVVFHTTLKKIHLPEYQPLDDDFAKDFSEYDTLRDWKDAIRRKLEASRRDDAQEKTSDDILSTIIDSSEIPINEELKEELAKDFFEDFRDQLRERGLTPEDYYRKTGRDEADMMERYDKRAVRTIQEQSVFHAIAEKEDIPPEEALNFVLDHADYV